MHRSVLLAAAALSLTSGAMAQEIDPDRLRVNITATFMNDYGQPLEGVTVLLVGEGGDQPYKAVVPASGTVLFEKVRPGAYAVQLELSDFVIISAGDKTDSFNVTVHPDGSLDPPSLDLIVRPPKTKGKWKQILLFFGIAAAGGGAVV